MGILVVVVVVSLLGLMIRALIRTGPRIPRSRRTPDDIGDAFLADQDHRTPGPGV